MSAKKQDHATPDSALARPSSREHLSTELLRISELAFPEAEMWQRTFDAVPDLVAILDTQHRIVRVNKAMAERLGRSKNQCVGQTCYACIHGTNEPPSFCPHSQLLRDGQEHTLEIYEECLGGDFVVSVSPLRDSAGRLVGSVHVARDITDRKENESERAITIDLLHLVNQKNGRHELMQAVTALLQEWSACEAVGIRLHDGEDFPYYETRGFPAEFVLAENRLCAVDAQGDLPRDNDGNPVLACMCGNVLRGRFDPTKPFFTANGSFWTNSTSELLASTTEAQRQGSTRNRCHSQGYESVALIPLRAFGETFGLLQLNDHRKGRFTPAKILLLERLADSLALGLARREAQETLLRAEKIRTEAEKLAAASRVAAQVAHEINNPLAGIKNSFRLIRDAVPADHPNRDMVERIDREIDRIAHIVRQMYELYSPQTHRSCHIPVSETISDVLAMLQPLCQQHKVAVKVRGAPSDLAVWAPEGSLQQILFNLTANAIQASPSRHHVNILVRNADNDRVQISIRDHGHGIRPEIRDRVFEPFFSTETADSPKKGLGLGLAIVKTLVGAIGGSIEFDSAVDQGTCFRVCLPSKEPKST
jgi:PAS domain S-box-containing protein